MLEPLGDIGEKLIRDGLHLQVAAVGCTELSGGPEEGGGVGGLCDTEAEIVEAFPSGAR